MVALGEKTPLKESKGQKNEDGGKDKFSGTLSAVLSCVGCAVGTGNIWRFPRIVAQASGPGGALTFIMVWLLFLFIWSIPMLVIEYAMGRYTKRAVVQSFYLMIGIKFLWAGLFIAASAFLILCYYIVIMGWSLFYIYRSIGYPLPTQYEESEEIFDAFTQGPGYPVITQVISLLFTVLAVTRGVRTLERANLVFTPAFLIIIVFIWIWSMTRENAMTGLTFLFTPDWATFGNPTLWVEALTQNAFDTGAGSGSLVSYGTYLSADDPILKYSLGIPLCNNFISLICGMTSFSTAFASLHTIQPNITDAEVLTILQTSGPGSTGVTFIWYPVLLSTAGTLGRVICVFFYIGLFLAGLSSGIAMIENTVRNLVDVGMKRWQALLLESTLLLVIGLGSAFDLEILQNQDFTWGFSLLLTGLMLQLVVIRFGSSNFRQVLINSNSKHDWYLPVAWEWMIKVVCPIEAIVVLLWWVIDGILNTAGEYKWYQLGPETVMTVLLQCTCLLLLLLLVNHLIYNFKPAFILERLDNGKFENLEGDVNDSKKDHSMNDIVGDTTASENKEEK